MGAPSQPAQRKSVTATDLDAVKQRHPEAFRQPFFKRFAIPLAIATTFFYVVYVAWFFSVSKVMNDANWEIAGSYLADWVSYEVRPDVDYRTGEIKVEYPRFSPLGENPDPDWLTTTQGTVEIYAQNGSAASNSQPAASGSFMSPSSSTPNTGSGAANSFMSPSSSATSTGSSVDQVDASDDTVAENETRQGIAQAEIVYGSAGKILATPQQVTITRGAEVLTINVDPIDEQVIPESELPNWALQKVDGGKIFIDFGFDGRAEVRAMEIKINRRFLGWENFFFDTASPFWQMSFGQVVSTVFSGDRLVADKSNLSLMYDNFIHNADWQHGDVFIKLLQTIVMAFVGTLFAVIIAFPLSFAAARNITPNRFVNQVLKRFFDFFRSVDMLIWALFFTRAFGPGPLAGISAIFLTDTGTFGKLFSEALENTDDKQREGVRSVGAPPAAVQRYGIVPQVLPVLISQALYFWESNTRSATIIGAVGAGGIGLKLWEAMRTNQDWENVFYMVILILIVVFGFDAVSNALRSRLIGKQSQ